MVQEAASVGEEVEGFKRIRAVPDVIAADLVQRYFCNQCHTPQAEVNDPAGNTFFQ